MELPDSRTRFIPSHRNSLPQEVGFLTCSCLLRTSHCGLLLVLLLLGCRSAPITPALQRFEFRHAAMGTLYHATLFAPNQDQAETAADLAFHRIDALEDVMSDYQADSELNLLCQQPWGRPVPISPDLFDVLERSQKVATLSQGAFDVTVGPFVRLWRFSRKRKVLPAPAELAAARAAVGCQKLRLDSLARTATLLAPHMRLDVGGIAKGYAADQALKVLKGKGIDRALVAASGDIAVGSPPPGQPGWTIGISPMGARSNEVARTVMLVNAAISTSGDTEQFIEIDGVRYSHIVNPATGLGMTERIQVSVIGPDATTTDSLATAVSVLGLKPGLDLIDSLPRTAAFIFVPDGERLRAIPSRRFDRRAVRAGLKSKG